MLRLFYFLLLLIFTWPIIATADADVEARVVNVLSGDVLIVSVDHKAEIVRLSGVDCPVRGEAGWLEIREYTQGMVLHKTVRIEPVGHQRAGMIRGRVFVGTQCLNDALKDIQSIRQ